MMSLIIQCKSDMEAECEKLGIEVIDMELHHVGVPHLIIELKENVLNITDMLEILGNILYEHYCENIDVMVLILTLLTLIVKPMIIILM